MSATAPASIAAAAVAPEPEMYDPDPEVVCADDWPPPIHRRGLTARRRAALRSMRIRGREQQGCLPGDPCPGCRPDHHGGPLDAGVLLCERCRAARDRRRERQRRRKREQRGERRAAGRCTRCGAAETVDGYRCCRPCLDRDPRPRRGSRPRLGQSPAARRRATARASAVYYARRDAGLCVGCGVGPPEIVPPSTGRGRARGARLLCAECRERRRLARAERAARPSARAGMQARERETYAELRAVGVCYACRAADADGGTGMCARCRARSNARRRARYAEAVAARDADTATAATGDAYSAPEPLAGG